MVFMPAGIVWSRAYGISDAGHIVGEFSQGSGVRGFMIHQGVFYNMGTLVGGNKSVVNVVNSSGLVVGFWGNVVIGFFWLFVLFTICFVLFMSWGLSYGYSGVNLSVIISLLFQ
jgi:hypothetical protein